MQVFWTDTGHLVGFLGDAFGDTGVAGLAVLARAQDRSLHIDRLGGELSGLLGAGEDHRRSAVADRRAHHAGERFGDDWRREHLFDGARSAELRMRIEAAVGVVLAATLAKCSLVVPYLRMWSR